MSPSFRFGSRFCGSLLHLALFLACLTFVFTFTVNALQQSQEQPRQLQSPRGSASRPTDRQKIALLGAGGYHGGLTFGFLQRAGNLYGTGLNGGTTLGACADTAVQLNRRLGANFGWAHANEMSVRLTDLQSCSAIQQSLAGMDALIIGTDLTFKTRTVTANTYEKSPNDRVTEVYWGIWERGAQRDTSIQQGLMENVFKAAQATKLKHLVVVDDLSATNLVTEQLSQCNIPYTRIVPMGDLERQADFTYTKGVCSNLQIDTNEPSTTSKPVYVEDIAALSIQCLQSLDWTKSRTLYVTNTGPLTGYSSGKRTDQEWCVNSDILAEKLAAIE